MKRINLETIIKLLLNLYHLERGALDKENNFQFKDFSNVLCRLGLVLIIQKHIKYEFILRTGLVQSKQKKMFQRIKCQIIGKQNSVHIQEQKIEILQQQNKSSMLQCLGCFCQVARQCDTFSKFEWKNKWHDIYLDYMAPMLKQLIVYLFVFVPVTAIKTLY